MAKLGIRGYFMVNMVSSFGVYRRFTTPVRILKLKRVGSNFGGSEMTFQYKLCMLADVERDEHVPVIPAPNISLQQHGSRRLWDISGYQHVFPITSRDPKQLLPATVPNQSASGRTGLSDSDPPARNHVRNFHLWAGTENGHLFRLLDGCPKIRFPNRMG